MTSSAFYASHHQSLPREMQESAHEAAAARPLHLLRSLQTMVEGGRTSSSPSSRPAAGREGNGQLWEEWREAAAALGVESAERGRRDAGDRSDPDALHGVAAEARGWRRRRGRGARMEEVARMEEEARTRLGFMGKTQSARSRSCPRCLPFWSTEKSKMPLAR
ncbi:hypothetical protein VPH35_093004 [Triticum aestivum]